MENKKIIIGCDHAAFPLKEKIKEYFKKKDIYIEDIGAFNDSSVDYSDIGIKLASLVSEGKFEKGILMCGTGLGMSMVANRFPHIRAALCSDIFSAIMSRRHNDSNILVMGGRVIGDALAIEILKAWLKTPFDSGRHQIRLSKFDLIQLK
jgi:ribose 5-phosphate isomerase B